jgi:hypothetical protein
MFFIGIPSNVFYARRISQHKDVCDASKIPTFRSEHKSGILGRKNCKSVHPILLLLTLPSLLVRMEKRRPVMYDCVSLSFPYCGKGGRDFGSHTCLLKRRGRKDGMDYARGCRNYGGQTTCS